MAYRGRCHPTIAQDTGTSPRSVQHWFNAYRDRGLEGLQPRKAKGAAPRLTAAVAPLLRQWVLDGPAACGLERANWTYVALADHL
jgi:transposase